MIGKKVLAVGLSSVFASAGFIAATSVPAHSDNTAISIEKVATRSATGKLMYVKADVVCSDDTTSARVSVQVSQTDPAGGTQTNTAWIDATNAVECTGNEEAITIPVRRPIGGYNWQAGSAAVRNVVFVTTDPSGTYCAFLKARTVTVK